MPNQNSPALLEEFPPVTREQWDRAIRKDLNGADYEKRLVWHTRAGIRIKPYYRAEDLESLDYLFRSRPGEFPYVRGARPANDWKIREEIDLRDCAEANAAARKALAGGAEEICFRRAVPKTLSDLHVLLEGLDGRAIHLWAEAATGPLLSLIVESGIALRGTLSLDPFDDPDAATSSLKRSPGPALRPIAIRDTSVLDAGATPVQEAGFLLAAGIEYLKRMTARGITVDQAAEGLWFGMSAGASYFFQIAKFRAFRMLWARAVESFGGSKEAAKAYLASRTADWNHTIYDAYNNVLRGTTEAMSAAMGGVDSLSVAPFDETYRDPDETSRRLARNTQIILKQEALLDRSVDPAAGSYYIESLTDLVAQAAWKLMQQVESTGGYLVARDSGMIAAEIRDARNKFADALAFRRRIIVGANGYPNPDERMLDRIEPNAAMAVNGRGAAMFESIRLRTERHAAAGNRTPRLLLAEMGDLKPRKARSAFALSFFGVAGFEMNAQYFETPQELGAALAGFDAVVLCSSDKEYSNLAAPVIAAVSGIPVIVAGNPKDAARLEQAGVAGFVHIKSNVLDTLTAWQARLGVKG